MMELKVMSPIGVGPRYSPASALKTMGNQLVMVVVLDAAFC